MIRIVVALPDLYPKNKGFNHETVEDLCTGIMSIFARKLQSKGFEDERLRKGFKVFCFKHDLEALILADQSELQNRLGVDSLDVTWRIPVEDQNHDCPPSQVVKHLFQNFGKRYKKTVDAPWILGKTSYREIAERCPQCF
ncbi:MAG: DUF4276 family protein [Xenococcaceae cyanobacterium]